MTTKLKRGTQHWFAQKLLHQRGFDPEWRLRRRIERWRLPGLPGRTSRTILGNLGRLRRLAPPRVRAAVFSTLFNRWVTDRRMRTMRGSRRSCLLGCSPQANDSIEHYMHCPVVQDWASSRLRAGGSPRSPMERWMLATPLGDDELRRTATTIYVTYRTTNHVRHKRGASSDYIRHFMNQMLYEAVRDDPGLRACCRGLVASPTGRRRRRE